MGLQQTPARCISLLLLAPFLYIATMGCGNSADSDDGAPPIDETAGSTESTAWFREVHTERGLIFLHRHGGAGEKYVMETMGSGAGFFDYDNDGFLDAYLVQSGTFDGAPADRSSSNRLFRNRGDGVFDDVTEAAGAGDTGYGMGVAFGDYDNDGFADIFVTNFGANALYRNQKDGTFMDVTNDTGLGDPRWGVGAAFADYDLDGDLDLYVVNYLTYSIEDNIRCGPKGILAYCHPDVYPGSPDILYRNEGGRFIDVTRDAGVHNADPTEAKGMGVVWLDYDSDGDPDIYVTNDSTPNFLYRNNGDGTFTNVALEAGVAYNKFGQTEAGMGVDVGDYDWNGHPDLFMTHLDAETNTLYRNFGGGVFQDYSSQSRLGAPSLKSVGFGTGIADLDNDGWLDIFVANGHILEAIERIEPGSGVTYAQSNQLFRNEGGTYFRELSETAGDHFHQARVSRGVAFGDIDNDGDADILIANNNQEAVLLENLVGARNEWIGFQLRGRKSNSDAIGARVVLVFGQQKRWKEIHTGASYLSQSDLRVVFGLAGGERPEQIFVRWPTGNTQALDPGLQTGRYHVVEEKAGTES